MSDQSDDSVDPLEEFSAEQQALDSLAGWIFTKISAKFVGSSSRRRTRKYINRNREGAHQQLVADYFAEEPLYSDAMFRRRFRMRRHVFLCIVDALADGIYPEWAAFVKSINSPQLQKHKVYAAEQEGARKDVERAFGVLQARFNIVRRPTRSWSIRIIRQIMKACVILHNMIVEDEGEMAEQSIDLNAIPRASIVLPPEVQCSLSPRSTKR